MPVNDCISGYSGTLWGDLTVSDHVGDASTGTAPLYQAGYIVGDTWQELPGEMVFWDGLSYETWPQIDRAEVR